MKIGHVGKKTTNENWHVEWKSKNKIFRLGIFKKFTADWESWKERIPHDTWQRIMWITSRFVWIIKEIQGTQYRLFCFAFGWRYQLKGDLNGKNN